MPRKKKEDTSLLTEENRVLFSDLDPDIKKTIFAVILLTGSLVLGLSFFGLAGGLGEVLEKTFSRLIGFCRYLLPLGMIILSVMYFKRLKGKAYWSLWIGLILIALGVLGLFHFFNDIEEMKELAREGKGGGCIGLSVAYLIKRIAGIYAGSIILIAFIIIGVLITFNSYLAKLFKKKEDVGKKKEDIGKEIPVSSKKNVLILKDGYNGKAKISNEKVKIFSRIKNALKKEKGKKSELANEEMDDRLKLKTQDKKKNRRSLLSLGKKKSNVGVNWKLPPVSLLKKGTGKPSGGDVKKNACIIKRTLKNFGIEAEVIDSNVGPTVTQYAIRPAEGIRLSKIIALQNDLAMALAAHPIRIEAPIPGKSLVGLEIPNEKFALVRIRSLVDTPEFMEGDGLTIGLGETASGDYLYTDLIEMPHLLISGATGAGKSIGISSIINSLIFKQSPQDLKLILIDPKRVELTVYNGIPHLLTEVIVELDKVVNALKWTIAEMERRYEILQKQQCRNIGMYNRKIEEQGINIKIKDEDKDKNKKYSQDDPANVEKAEEGDLEKLPYIVVVIDELADIMVSHGKEVEALIVRIAQKARAIGIHLILSTQRPSVEVITGLIKANIPTRIAYQVASQIDSRTILDKAGAEKLLGKGDMLYLAREENQPRRIQGSYIEEKEIERIVNFLKKQGEADYDEEIIKSRTLKGFNNAGIFDSSSNNIKRGSSDYEDDLFEAAKEVIIENKKASATFLQRKLRIGYARAARLMEMLEEENVIGPYSGAKPREILAGKNEDIGYEDDIIDQNKRNKWGVS